MTTATGASSRAHKADALGDFAADRRILVTAAMALVVGTGGAMSAWLLIKLIAVVTDLVWFGRLSTASLPMSGAHPGPWMVAAPALGGLVIGLMARFGSEKIRGHGIPEAIEAILIGGSRMSPKVAVLKPLSSAISIGAGGPFGAEGPIIMTGGAIGSLFGQLFRLTAAERKALLVAGAAAGMTAIFGTPIAAVLLAVELLLFEWRPRSFLPVVTAVVVAAAFRPWLFGTGPLFPYSGGPDVTWPILLLCAGAGIVAGLQSSLATTILYALEDAFERLPLHWMGWPAIGGLAVGLGGLVEPRALGVGYDVIRDLLSGHLSAGAAGRILAVKGGIWSVALASGTSGGVLAPLLILGGALGLLEGQFLPGDPGFWALVGMAAMMGGTMRAPLTGALFAVELTGDVHALLPLLAATGAAYGLTVLVLKRSILTEKIARRGRHVFREYGVDPLRQAWVREIMVTAVDTLPGTMAVDEATAFFTAGDGPKHKSYPVVDEAGRVLGMASRGDVLRWLREGDHGPRTLADLVERTPLVAASPDELVWRIVERMVAEDVGRVPVTDADGRLVGLVSRKDLLRVRARLQHQEEDRTAYLGPRARRGRRRGKRQQPA
ncbi:MAG TPA: chloride channel protein [Caulobacteraceae bacterium]|nr:chloride channel protein [Caulobacteraceae bacterium]